MSSSPQNAAPQNAAPQNAAPQNAHKKIRLADDYQEDAAVLAEREAAEQAEAEQVEAENKAWLREHAENVKADLESYNATLCKECTWYPLPPGNSCDICGDVCCGYCNDILKAEEITQHMDVCPALKDIYQEAANAREERGDAKDFKSSIAGCSDHAPLFGDDCSCGNPSQEYYDYFCLTNTVMEPWMSVDAYLKQRDKDLKAAAALREAALLREAPLREARDKAAAKALEEEAWKGIPDAALAAVLDEMEAKAMPEALSVIAVGPESQREVE